MNYFEAFETIKSLLNRLEEMVLSFRMQNFNRGERIFEKWSEELGGILTLCAEHKIEIDAEPIAELLNAMEQKDYVLMADILMLQLKPFLEGLIGSFTNLCREEISVNGDDDAKLLNICGYEYEDNGRLYQIEPTGSGLLTLAITDENGKYYLHGNDNPYTDAKLMIRQYYDEHCDKYIVFGLGLCYHVLALIEACHGLVDIEVYESDEVIIELTRRTFDLHNYPCLKIIYDPGLEKFSAAANLGTLIIHYPSIRNISNPAIRNRMHQLFVQDSSIRNQIGEMLANFRYNISHITKSIDAKRDCFKDKVTILVAAGPSLDKNIERLKRRKDDTVVICVGTAFRKLMNAGIVPDFVAVLDASERIRTQINGYENSSVPLIAASTATLSITRDYAGEKYIVCQRGMEEAENFAISKGYEIFESGGSVATLIMDVAVRLGSKRIIAVGLDLAYSGNKYHANGAGRCSTIESLDGLIETKASDGSRLYTTQAMNMYREWFEEYIVRHKAHGIEFIDATEGGVVIKGMVEKPLKEAL